MSSLCREVERIWAFKSCKSGKPKQIYTRWPFGWRPLRSIYAFVYLFLEVINAIGYSIIIVRVDNKQHLELEGKSHQYFCVWGRIVNQAEEPMWLRTIH